MAATTATATTTIFPLRWEGTGDHWWFASPVDLAAATGHYDLLRVLLRGDPNLLIQLTSLRRLRRLETVWDDDPRFSSAPRRRSAIARALLLDGGGELLRAGYGGWLLYTAASAGDLLFVEELLQRNPLLAFGEGEFGVTDVLYAAARGRSPEVFRMVYGTAGRAGGESEVFWRELRNRAVHAAARGGCWEVLQELLEGCGDVLEFRDAKGSTVLHAAAGKGQVEVVKGLIEFFDIIDSRDDHGNTSLHVAAFQGHLAVMETLLNALPMSAYSMNDAGDTFLHVAVAGFKAPGFHWLDHQMELMRSLISGHILNLDDLINLRNNDGRTVLHMAVGEKVHPDLVSLLMSVNSIDLNIRDTDGMTPLDLLCQRPQSTSSEILIKQLISAGGMSFLTDNLTRSIIASQIKMQSICNSPGTSFRISDAEIFFYTTIKSSNTVDCKDYGGPSLCVSFGQSVYQSEESDANKSSEENKRHLSASCSLKNLLQWPQKEKVGILQSEDDDSVHPSNVQGTIPLRQKFSKGTSLPTHKRTLSIQSNSMPSPSTRKRFTSRLTHGVIQALPQMVLLRTSLSSPSRMSVVPRSPFRQMGSCSEQGNKGPSTSLVVTGGTPERPSQKSASRNNGPKKIRYFCFGSGCLRVNDSSNRHQLRDYFKDSVLAAA